LIIKSAKICLCHSLQIADVYHVMWWRFDLNVLFNDWESVLSCFNRVFDREFDREFDKAFVWWLDLLDE